MDWISDVVNWIGEGVSSVWDNTVLGTVDDITDTIFDAMFQWTYGLIFGAISDIFTFINNSSADIFTLPWVQAFISLFANLAWMLFLCGFVVSVFDTAIAYEGGQNNIKTLCLNTLKGFLAVNLVTVVPQRLYTFCTSSTPPVVERVCIAAAMSGICCRSRHRRIKRRCSGKRGEDNNDTNLLQ